MENHIAASAYYRKMASNLLALAFLATGMVLAMYLGAFP
jgi:hypothetical protein